MSGIDLGIVGLYLIGIFVFGHSRKSAEPGSPMDYLLGGRRLTLPAFVASLVATWYGGILGIGEYTFRYGISNWLVFGLPYYLAAFLFAILLAAKARRTQFITIPDRLRQVYGRHVSGVSALVLFFWALPTAYILILGVLGNAFFGWHRIVGIVAGTVVVLIYAYAGGFRSLVKADIWHFSAMYVGFLVTLIVLITEYGGYSFIKAHVPPAHLTWHGGNPVWFIAVWYVIALATLVDTSFFQNCYAAKDESVARRGILISIVCWCIFDFMTTACGLYARALLPTDIDPVSSFPLLGAAVLPSGMYGIFAVGMLATVISTADSYLFIAASTVGKDILCGWLRKPEEHANRYTKVALLLGALLTVVIAMFFESVVTVWYGFGSIGTSILLVPLLTTFFGRRRMRPGTVLLSMAISGLLSSLWLWSKTLTSDSSYWLGMEPIFPGLASSLIFYFVLPADRKNENQVQSSADLDIAMSFSHYPPEENSNS